LELSLLWGLNVVLMNSFPEALGAKFTVHHVSLQVQRKLLCTMGYAGDLAHEYGYRTKNAQCKEMAGNSLYVFQRKERNGWDFPVNITYSLLFNYPIRLWFIPILYSQESVYNIRLYSAYGVCLLVIPVHADSIILCPTELFYRDLFL
jgi:hypothetical protein